MSAPQPPANPVQEAYERWSSQTPLVARSTMIGVAVVYLLSWFFDADMVLGNVPYFSLMHFEVYRIFLSFLVGNSFLSVIMIAFFFPIMAGRMENALGSSGLLILMGTIALVTNLLFDFLCFTMNILGNPEAMFWSCSSFWTVIFGLVTIECMQMPDVPRRMFLIPVDIPSKFFPMVLYGFFCLFSGLILSYFISIVVGYCYAMGYLDALKVSQSRLAQSEADGWLSSLSRTNGWVPIGSALGHAAWTSPPQAQQPPQTQERGIGGTSGGPRVFGFNGSSAADAEEGRGGASKQEREPLLEQFPGSGRTLATGSGGGLFSSTIKSTSASREAIAAQRLSALGVTNSSSTSSAIKGTTVASPQRQPSAPPIEQSHDVTALVDMGFTRIEAMDALAQAGGSVDGAMDILLNGKK